MAQTAVGVGSCALETPAGSAPSCRRRGVGLAFGGGGGAEDQAVQAGPGVVGPRCCEEQTTSSSLPIDLILFKCSVSVLQSSLARSPARQRPATCWPPSPPLAPHSPVPHRIENPRAMPTRMITEAHRLG